MIKAEIIADSIGPHDCRITSWILEYPRFIHAEIMTHRAFSKNAASSRAIPIEKMLQQVIDNPAMPVWWGKNQSGMQAREELDDIKKTIYSHTEGGGIVGEYDIHLTPKEYCKETWLTARDSAIEYVKKLNKAGLHKQIANRILEPWFNIRVILTGTDFDNFFALRAHPDAQPEFQELANKMLELYNANEPKSLDVGEWHLPFGDRIDEERVKSLIHYDSIKGSTSTRQDFLMRAKIKIATARCARVSYFNFEGKDDYEKDIEVCDKLFGNIPRHLSPAEHPAVCLQNDRRCGNFRGWEQYRKSFADENLTDSRVIKKKWKGQN